MEEVQRGERVTAERFNQLLREVGVARNISGPGVKRTGNGTIIRPTTRPSAAVIAFTGAFAMITSKAGSAPPYNYAAVQATMDAAGEWSEVDGGGAYNNVFNLEEQGTGGQWVNPLNVGDVVVIFAAPDPDVDAFVCMRSHYRGTY